ncbi:MAG TPA: NADH-quinone oxidoreductase subunit J [Saprospiraceae bacterium]|nr:NADH-quinone oxidoreductase subunit J [Saprospiraceae bacterium]
MILTTFYILSAIAIVCALMVVLSKNPVHSVLYLVTCFFAFSGHYILMNAQFLAVVNIIVYAGAIMVLFLFVVMLLNLNKQNQLDKSNVARLASVIGAGALLLIIVASVKSAELDILGVTQLGELGTVQAIGKELFSTYLLPFEISSVLLFSAIVGAILLGKKEI